MEPNTNIKNEKSSDTTTQHFIWEELCKQLKKKDCAFTMTGYISQKDVDWLSKNGIYVYLLLNQTASTSKSSEYKQYLLLPFNPEEYSGLKLIKNNSTEITRNDEDDVPPCCEKCPVACYDNCRHDCSASPRNSF